MLTYIRTLEENNQDFPDGPVAKNSYSYQFSQISPSCLVYIMRPFANA